MNGTDRLLTPCAFNYSLSPILRKLQIVCGMLPPAPVCSRLPSEASRFSHLKVS